MRTKLRGFTLIETLVAILALTLSLGALTLITSRTTVNSREAERRVQAEFLAVEAIEIAQQLIMSEVLAGNIASPFGMIKPCGQGCRIDYTDAVASTVTLAACTNPAGDCARVKNIPSAAGVVVNFTNNATTTEATSFRRILYIKPTGLNDNGVFVRAVVWYTTSDALIQKQIVLTKEFRPWYEEQDLTPTTPLPDPGPGPGPTPGPTG